MDVSEWFVNRGLGNLLLHFEMQESGAKVVFCTLKLSFKLDYTIMWFFFLNLILFTLQELQG